MSLFKELYHRNVNEYTKKNNNLTYLSWTYAWGEIKKIDEAASYEIFEYPMLDANFTPIAEGLNVPYLKTPEGYFVKVSVTINGKTETETLPVMDNKNVPFGAMAPQWVSVPGKEKKEKQYAPTPAPTSFDINTSHKRCMVKAIALHGLGLDIDNGEDVPEVDQEVIKKQKEQEETDRKNFISMVKELANSRNELAAKLSELEHTVKSPVEKFSYKAAERAYQILSEMMAPQESNA